MTSLPELMSSYKYKDRQWQGQRGAAAFRALVTAPLGYEERLQKIMDTFKVGRVTASRWYSRRGEL